MGFLLKPPINENKKNQTMLELSHITWPGRYRPRTVEECILPKAIKEQALGFIENKAMPHLFLHGTSGVGKTTISKAIAEQLGYETLLINASNEGRLIDTLRSKIASFAGTMSMDGSRKCLILDEFDGCTDLVQFALKSFIEDYEINCTFVITCNFPNKVIDAIKSRCTNIHFTIPKNEVDSLTKQMFIRATEILKENEIEYDKVAVGKIIKRNFPDFRRTLNELQRFGAYGKIDSDALSSTENDNIDELIKILRDKNFAEMRKWVAACPSQDISTISRKLYDKSNTFIVNANLPEMIIHLADYSYKNAFVSDVEINIVAMLTRIMMDCEMK